MNTIHNHTRFVGDSDRWWRRSLVDYTFFSASQLPEKFKVIQPLTSSPDLLGQINFFDLFAKRFHRLIMAYRIAIRPSLTFVGLQTSKQHLGIAIQSVIRLQQTQAAMESVDAKSYDQIPGPKGLPLVGTLFDYVRNKGHTRVHEIQGERVQKYGEIYREKLLDLETVTISNVDDVQYLFRNEGKYPQREPQFPLWMKYKEERKQAHGVFSL